jgi:energy-converting hydrogenase Eha subunit A
MKTKKFGWSQYFKPTPKNIRQLGDAALAAAAIGVLIVPGAKWVAIMGIAGKFLSNFLADK